ncbi:lipoprotein [Corynebacterium suranareeae]|uniref:Lipoprotein n=1 Tax=Corynebacterium suranareeae TaxID=2506452 RepID=A0A160PM96_9CORY|nr:YdhK family protein [Corynebacterium suranareeae]BAU94396.1 lipoprotein [Corynebacterium suranareeae]
MKRSITLAALVLTSTLALTACSDATDNSDDADTTSTTTATAETNETHQEDTTTADDGGHDMEHPEDGGPPPEGITEATDPTYPVGSEVMLRADHMPGMDGAQATISGAFDTTTYSVSYTPTDGGEPVTDHRWVVHEELVDPGEAPLPGGTEVVLNAEHMPGMQGATATIDYSTQETVYMVDIDTGEMTMINHKWVTESEIQPAE